MAKSAIAHSGRFSERMATRSPGLTPACRSAVASQRTVSRNSEMVVSTHRPSRLYLKTAGGSEATVRANMVTGPNTGISDMVTAIDESGLVMIGVITNQGIIITIWIGNMSCCASLSVLHAAPATA